VALGKMVYLILHTIYKYATVNAVLGMYSSTQNDLLEEFIMKRTKSSTTLFYNWNTKQYTFVAESQGPDTLSWFVKTLHTTGAGH
jgi:hypothetical protein